MRFYKLNFRTFRLKSGTHSFPFFKHITIVSCLFLITKRRKFYSKIKIKKLKKVNVSFRAKTLVSTFAIDLRRNEIELSDFHKNEFLSL